MLKDDYCTNSHYLPHTFLLKGRGMHFLNLGVKGLTTAEDLFLVSVRLQLCDIVTVMVTDNSVFFYRDNKRSTSLMYQLTPVKRIAF